MLIRLYNSALAFFFFLLLREMLPLLLISTLPAFTLLLAAPATKACCKLARELALLALLLATELLRHATAAAAAAGSRERERGARMPSASSKPAPALASAPSAEAETTAAAAAAAAGLPLLDLPELALDRVLEELSPSSLAAMACVCSALRDRCSADALWGRHLRIKWGRVLGAAARREWDAELGGTASGSGARAGAPRPTTRRRSWVDSLACAWPFSSWIGCRWLLEGDHNLPSPAAESTPAPAPAAPRTDTVAAWYRALECGEFWFPAQVYNREVSVVPPIHHHSTARRIVFVNTGARSLAGRACRVRALVLRRAPPLPPAN